jgi:hypothetical protein
MRFIRSVSADISRYSTVTAMVVLLSAVQGCMPGWYHKTHSAAYQGRVFDAETQQPITKVRIELRGDHLTKSTTTDARGNYEVGPLRCCHFCLWIAGPEGHADMCHHYDEDGVVLEASRSGYGPVTVAVPRYTTNEANRLIVSDMLLQPNSQTK